MQIYFPLPANYDKVYLSIVAYCKLIWIYPFYFYKYSYKFLKIRRKTITKNRYSIEI